MSSFFYSDANYEESQTRNSNAIDPGSNISIKHKKRRKIIRVSFSCSNRTLLESLISTLENPSSCSTEADFK